MRPSVDDQKRQIADFTSLTEATNTVASKYLKECQWDLTQAINHYFNSTAHAVTSPLGKIFDSYRDDPKNHPDAIGPEGALNFFRDIEVQLDEVTCLAITELLESPSVGEFTRAGFMKGWLKEACDTKPKMIKHAKSLREKIPKDQETFRRIYRSTFLLSREQGQRNLKFDIAVDQWGLFFNTENGGVAWNTESTPWLDWWLEFLEKRGERPVNKDLWEQVEVFMRKSLEDEDMGWWDPEGAWPGALDDFVAWVREKRGNGSEMDVE